MLKEAESLRNDTFAAVDAAERAYAAKLDQRTRAMSSGEPAGVTAVSKETDPVVREGPLVWQKKKDKWKRMWGVIAEGALGLFPSFNWREGAKTTMCFNLQLASVKQIPDAPRPYCFQLATPDGMHIFEVASNFCPSLPNPSRG